MWFTGLIDEEEMAMLDQNMPKESISDLLEDIHNANEDGENQLDLNTFTLSKGSCSDIELGDYTIDFISLEVGAGKQTDPENNPMKRDPLVIDPSEMNRQECEAPEGYEGDFVKYSFHRLDESVMPDHEGEYVESDSVELEVIVKDDDKEKLRAYLFDQGLLKPGDPLVDMNIVHTNESSNSGGMFGCSRGGIGCDNSSIPNLPKYAGKENVHGGVDLGASLGTDVYAMYEGTVISVENDVPPNTEGDESDFGNYVLIKSTSNQHNVNNQTIFIIYTHLNGVNESVENGREIEQGAKIGVSGRTGNAVDIKSWRYHVHISVYENDTESKNKVNPVDYFNTKFDRNGNQIDN